MSPVDAENKWNPRGCHLRAFAFRIRHLSHAKVAGVCQYYSKCSEYQDLSGLPESLLLVIGRQSIKIVLV